MLSLKTGVLLLSFLTITFTVMMTIGLKRTYETQKISLPGIAIWIVILFVSFMIICVLLVVSIIGIYYYYF